MRIVLLGVFFENADRRLFQAEMDEEIDGIPV